MERNKVGQIENKFLKKVAVLIKLCEDRNRHREMCKMCSKMNQVTAGPRMKKPRDGIGEQGFRQNSQVLIKSPSVS